MKRYVFRTRQQESLTAKITKWEFHDANNSKLLDTIIYKLSQSADIHHIGNHQCKILKHIVGPFTFSWGKCLYQNWEINLKILSLLFSSSASIFFPCIAPTFESSYFKLKFLPKIKKISLLAIKHQEKKLGNFYPKLVIAWLGNTSANHANQTIITPECILIYYI